MQEIDFVEGGGVVYNLADTQERHAIIPYSTFLIPSLNGETNANRPRPGIHGIL